jgi:hypothetical protein
LTFPFLPRGWVGSECKIHSTATLTDRRDRHNLELIE